LKPVLEVSLFCAAADQQYIDSRLWVYLRALSRKAVCESGSAASIWVVSDNIISHLASPGNAVSHSHWPQTGNQTLDAQLCSWHGSGVQ